MKTNRMIENRVKKIQDLESQKKHLADEIERLKQELKSEMEDQGVSVIQTEKGVTVRWQEIVSDRFDSKNFKAEHPKFYNEYVKSSVSHRFTWTA